MSPLRSAVALAAGIAALLSAAPAEAYTSEQIARYNAVADQVWGGACAGRLRAQVVADFPENRDASRSGYRVVGQAKFKDPDCVYKIAEGLDDYPACLTVVHEAGHIWGYVSSDPATDPETGLLDPMHDRGATIMNPTPEDVLPDGAYKPCASLLPITLSQSAAVAWVEARWGRHMVSLDCRRDQIVSRMRCWGTSAMGRHLRWTVWRGEGYRVHGGRWK